MFDPIIAEELELLENVSTLIGEMTGPATPDEAPIIRELEVIREQLVSGSDRKDAGALTQQWHRQSSLLRQLRQEGRARLLSLLGDASHVAGEHRIQARPRERSRDRPPRFAGRIVRVPHLPGPPGV